MQICDSCDLRMGELNRCTVCSGPTRRIGVSDAGIMARLAESRRGRHYGGTSWSFPLPELTTAEPKPIEPKRKLGHKIRLAANGRRRRIKTVR
jgi:hypothetical protein